MVLLTTCGAAAMAQEARQLRHTSTRPMRGNNIAARRELISERLEKTNSDLSKKVPEIAWIRHFWTMKDKQTISMRIRI